MASLFNFFIFSFHCGTHHSSSFPPNPQGNGLCLGKLYYLNFAILSFISYTQALCYLRMDANELIHYALWAIHLHFNWCILNA